MSSSNTKLTRFLKVMQEVYGECTASNAAGWTPKPYSEYKGRYLWTDAFGVCNYITLFCETKDGKYLDQADALITNVHDTLGKDRSLQRRLGDATDDDPLRGGLRIGKIDPEGTRDGDGQYFHYLTKWMFALNRMGVARKDPKYNRWAIQLAKAIHPAFVSDTESSRPRMYWKMSIDLKTPAVRSEGNLDPFDGYMTYRILADHAPDRGVLAKEINDLQKIVNSKYMSYSSDDPLDLGEALWITHWYANEDWCKRVATVSIKSLDALYRMGYFSAPTYYRLAFREFGTTIGVQVNPIVRELSPEWPKRAEALNDFWEKEGLYTRDKDITPVMFCTSLIPGAFQRDYVETKIREIEAMRTA